MPAISKEWIQEQLKKYDGSPIHAYLDEEEYYHPITHMRYTLQFVFTAMRPNGTWQTGKSQFEVNEEGMEMENATDMFHSYMARVQGQYREFIGKVMGFHSLQQQIVQRLQQCQQALKECNDGTSITKKISKKAVAHGDRRHKGTKTR